jgi:hypothetical protein
VIAANLAVQFQPAILREAILRELAGYLRSGNATRPGMDGGGSGQTAARVEPGVIAGLAQKHHLWQLQLPLKLPSPLESFTDESSRRE